MRSQNFFCREGSFIQFTVFFFTRWCLTRSCRFSPYLDLVHPSPCCHFETEIIDRDTTLVKILIGYDNPKAHWVHEQRCGQREQLCAPRTLLGYNRSLDPFRNYIVSTDLCFWSDKISISQLIIKIRISSIVIGLKNSYFPLIHPPSCYRTACYRTVRYRTVHTNQWHPKL